MDTIIYVVYRELQINRGSRAADQSEPVRVEQFSMGKDFQVLHLTVCERRYEAENLLQRLRSGNALQCLADCFPRLRARRIRKERELLADQIRACLDPLLDRWGENACIYAQHLQGKTGSDKTGIAQEEGGVWLPQALGNAIPEFQAYQEFRWIDRLLPYAGQEHFLALGTVGCIGQVLERLAPRMKSLLWIVPDYTYKAQVETVAERLYEEFGLAVDLRFLPEGAVFSRVRISGKYLTEPLNLLDFTGEKYVPPLTLAPGSVWLDLGAVEEKEKRIKGRRMPVAYVSLRTIAEHPAAFPKRNPQKKTATVLDTMI